MCGTLVERAQLHVKRATLHFNLAFFELGYLRRGEVATKARVASEQGLHRRWLGMLVMLLNVEQCIVATSNRNTCSADNVGYVHAPVHKWCVEHRMPKVSCLSLIQNLCCDVVVHSAVRHKANVAHANIARYARDPHAPPERREAALPRRRCAARETLSARCASGRSCRRASCLRSARSSSARSVPAQLGCTSRWSTIGECGAERYAASMSAPAHKHGNECAVHTIEEPSCCAVREHVWCRRAPTIRPPGFNISFETDQRQGVVRK